MKYTNLKPITITKGDESGDYATGELNSELKHLKSNEIDRLIKMGVIKKSTTAPKGGKS